MTTIAPSLRTFKILLWLWSVVPLADLVLRAFTVGLGTHPEEVFLRTTGTWALVLLLTTLSVTPARRIMRWPDLLRVRRMLGLWTFAYAAIHLLGFLFFEHSMNVVALIADAFKRPFVAVGLVAFLSMLPLALTSNHWSMRRLGGNWKKLHRLVYLVAALACVHFFLHRAGKANFADPIAALVILILLLLMRRFTASAYPARSRD